MWMFEIVIDFNIIFIINVNINVDINVDVNVNPHVNANSNLALIHDLLFDQYCFIVQLVFFLIISAFLIQVPSHRK